MDANNPMLALTLELIKHHYELDEKGFKKTCEEIRDELKKAGHPLLPSYVQALIEPLSEIFSPSSSDFETDCTRHIYALEKERADILGEGGDDEVVLAKISGFKECMKLFKYHE